ncbi:hypothetical protein Glove_562g6 [Diversispora epigaea]|uniref:ATP-dependent DNA helicase n=1 Tax=Diversispora epigaea TaxID=1348612 RepID=A0A397GAI9_9GLOM|nr:hypothetical protein Glove_562g6 [Diversispora epigaea]
MMQNKLDQTIDETSRDLKKILKHVGHKKIADSINHVICNMLPIQNDKYIISDVEDVINERLQDYECSDKLFKGKTNLPKRLETRIGAKIMFLNNSEYKHKMCKGTLGVNTDINKETQEIKCAFCIKGGIVDIKITKQVSSFYINGAPASRRQFPIINAYALTVHKTQGLTLPDISLNLDSQMWEVGQTE